MLSIQFIINIFKDTKAVQILFLLLLFSILLVLDLFLTIYISNIFGEYLVLAIICSISFIGSMFSVIKVKNIINEIKINCNNGNFPENYFFMITGIFAATIYIIIPGFISDIIGFVLLISFFSTKLGKFISNKTQTDWHTVYEFMKI